MWSYILLSPYPSLSSMYRLTLYGNVYHSIFSLNFQKWIHHNPVFVDTETLCEDKTDLIDREVGNPNNKDIRSVQAMRIQ
jgi:hypothetical protein